jgi:hypothetical protein
LSTHFYIRLTQENITVWERFVLGGTPDAPICSSTKGFDDGMDKGKKQGNFHTHLFLA